MERWLHVGPHQKKNPKCGDKSKVDNIKWQILVSFSIRLRWPILRGIFGDFRKASFFYHNKPGKRDREKRKEKSEASFSKNQCAMLKWEQVVPHTIYIYKVRQAWMIMLWSFSLCVRVLPNWIEVMGHMCLGVFVYSMSSTPVWSLICWIWMLSLGSHWRNILAHGHATLFHSIIASMGNFIRKTTGTKTSLH